jgi:hypothetical protein
MLPERHYQGLGKRSDEADLGNLLVSGGELGSHLTAGEELTDRQVNHTAIELCSNLIHSQEFGFLLRF